MWDFKVTAECKVKCDWRAAVFLILFLEEVQCKDRKSIMFSFKIEAETTGKKSLFFSRLFYFPLFSINDLGSIKLPKSCYMWPIGEALLFLCFSSCGSVGSSWETPVIKAVCVDCWGNLICHLAKIDLWLWTSRGFQ